MPIYYVIVERLQHPYSLQYDIKTIIAVYACDLSDIARIYDREVAPLTQMRNIYTEIFVREPTNPLKEQAIEDWD